MIRAAIIGLAGLQGCIDVGATQDWTVAMEQGVPDDPKGGGVQFTRPDGTPIFVNPRAVAFVRAPLPKESGKATIVFTSGATQAVLETVEQVIHGIHIDMPRNP